MQDTNYIGSVVKILEVPKQKLLNNKILVTECRAYFPQVKNSRIVYLKFWGRLANEILNNYKLNDYILIEGYVSLYNKKNSKIKEVNISVLKVYPAFLHYHRSTNKTLD